MMATGIILAGGSSTRMHADKAFMEVGGRRVIEAQLEVIDGLFEEVLIVANPGRTSRLAGYERAGVRVVEEPVGGKGPLGGILSGLMLSGSRANFVLACDMPFIRREAVLLVMESMAGLQVAVPRTPGGLEPLHAAYERSCAPVIERQLERGNLKVTGFFGRVNVREVPWEEFKRIDPSGRLLANINSPEDMLRAAAAPAAAMSRVGGGRMPDEIPQEVLEAVRKEAVDNKIPCQRAQELAGELGVSIPVVGMALDILKIKIIQCQLGCF
jgi:molybdopterin-guanine dinucleotide biosynthesis protein A